MSDIASVVTILLFVAVLSGFLAVGITAVVYYFILDFKHKDREKIALDSTLLQVALPRDNEVKIDAAEQLFSSFASLHKGGRFASLHPQPSLTFEIVGMPGDIRYYVSTPNKYKDFVEKQINGAYPDAEIREVSEKDSLKDGFVIGNDYNIFSQDSKVAFASIRLKEEDFKPIKVYKDLAVDPMSSITSTLAKMTEGEGAAIQISISPADSKWKKLGREHLAHTKKHESDPETAKYSTDPKELEGIENKIGKPGFDTIVRIVVSSSTLESAEAHLSNIEHAFAQFDGLNEFTKNKHRNKKAFMDEFVYRYMPKHGQTAVMNTEELATLFHFPNKAITTPTIFWVTSKRAPVAANIPTSGLFLGKSTYRGMSRDVHIGDDDRRRHMYIIGKTGTGKTEFLKQMITQDIKNGKGVGVVDPHGDLIEDILQTIPPERAEDVILFDPSDTTRPMGLNMLEASTEEEKHYVVSSIVGLMYKLYDPNKTGIIGPRFEHAIRNAMLTVMYQPGSTFIEVVRVLTDAKFVQDLLPYVQDPIVRRYWTDQIAQTSDFHKSEVLDYIVSKFGRFVTNKTMRNIIGQSQSAFNMRDVMDNQKILLVNLSKGKIGEENSSFLGLILVPKILIAAMSRQNMPMDQRKDFYLYVDEFQNFATPDFAQILSEARKYRLNLIVANQFIGQMEEEVKNAIFGNVGTLASFRVGVTDANYLQHEFQPTFSEADLINIDRFNCYMRSVVNGEPIPPFSLDTTKDMTAEKAAMNPRVSELIKELSRIKYGKDVNVIEQVIGERAQL
jgi:hypothetical protein